VVLAGEVWATDLPREVRRLQAAAGPVARAVPEKGWRRVVGSRTRNPVQRAHEYVQKSALEIVDGLFLHPLVGETKSDDVPASIRMESYQVLLDGYYPNNGWLLGISRRRCRYGRPARGDLPRPEPQELRLHPFHRRARPRRGRQLLRHLRRPEDLREFEPGRAGHHPAFFEAHLLLQALRRMATARPARTTARTVTLSGPRVREMLSQGELPPPEFSRPEVAEVLIRAWPSRPRPRWRVAALVAETAVADRKVRCSGSTARHRSWSSARCGRGCPISPA